MKLDCRRALIWSAVISLLSACQTSPEIPAASDDADVAKAMIRAPVQKGFALNEKGYFQNQGVGIMVFQDQSPESHQSGLIMVTHGTRLASNGDIRLEATPGQWSPVPKVLERRVDEASGEIITRLAYPNEEQHRKGFNPLDYPDLELVYEVRVKAAGDVIKVTVDLDQPLPRALAGRIGFGLELYPADLFGHSWYMDSKTGLFPRQPYGVTVKNSKSWSRPSPEIVATGSLKGLRPLANHRAEARPLAVGRQLTVAPESETLRVQISSKGEPLELLDGRVQHQNGWFVVRSDIRPGVTKNAVQWEIRPNVVDRWMPPPVIQHSMVGYHPNQRKVAVIEADPRDVVGAVQLRRLSPSGEHQTVLAAQPDEWGEFLRSRYFHFDFSEVRTSGLYQLVLGEQASRPFRIANDVFDQNVWQPTLDYFLPIQMGHMRVKEKYRLWHDASHLDDALMAPVNINHFDGYVQGPSTLTRFKPLQHVPGLAQGGWYDAGDEDFRIESQTAEIFILSAIYEEFAVRHDNTLVNQKMKLVELREPDGQPDILQQIDHGLLSVVGGYEALGRLYRGIIVPTLTQYVMGGDFAGQTDNRIYHSGMAETAKSRDRLGDRSGLPDDRWVFTENNPAREFDAIANITASVNPMRDFNPARAEAALRAATELWWVNRPVDDDHVRRNKIRAAVELFLVTGSDEYRQYLLSEREFIAGDIRGVGWAVARAVHQLGDAELVATMRSAAAEYYREVEQSMQNTPYGLDFEMQLWGRGWTLQQQGVQHYFLHRAFPEEFGREYLLNVLHYVLGTNPGSNSQSYVSGVGAKSKTSAYGMNRMDYGYIPGGVVVGTALIQPDFPELKEFPFLWQQSEYVLGGGASNFMFLALAAHHLLNGGDL